MIRRISTNIEHLKYPMNYQFKIHDDKTIISCQKCQKSTCLKWKLGLFGHNYRVATLFIFYPTVSEIIKLKSLGQL